MVVRAEESADRKCSSRFLFFVSRDLASRLTEPAAHRVGQQTVGLGAALDLVVGHHELADAGQGQRADLPPFANASTSIALAVGTNSASSARSASLISTTWPPTSATFTMFDESMTWIRYRFDDKTLTILTIKPRATAYQA